MRLLFESALQSAIPIVKTLRKAFHCRCWHSPGFFEARLARMIKAEIPTKAIAFDLSLALLNRMRRGTENEPEYRVITGIISTDSVIIHVKYWEELVRFGTTYQGCSITSSLRVSWWNSYSTVRV